MRLMLILLSGLLLVGCGAASRADAPTPVVAAPVANSPAPSATTPPSPTPAPSATTLPSPSATTLPSPSPAPSATALPSPSPSATILPSPSPAPSATAASVVAQPTADPTALAQAEGPKAPTAAPTVAGAAAPSDPQRLVIDAIGLDRSLIAVGLDKNRVPIVPNHDVGWYSYSARPGQGENIVLWGHVLRFKRTPDIPAPFARLKELSPGAALTLYSADGSAHRYVVTQQVYATPDQVEYILPTGREMLTLVSCIGDKVVVDNSVEMSHRLITIAEPAP